MRSVGGGAPTGHVHHPAVAVLHNVACLTVDPAGGHAVHREEARLQSLRLALAPGRRQEGELQGRKIFFFLKCHLSDRFIKSI